MRDQQLHRCSPQVYVQPIPASQLIGTEHIRLTCDTRYRVRRGATSSSARTDGAGRSCATRCDLRASLCPLGAARFHRTGAGTPPATAAACEFVHWAQHCEERAKCDKPEPQRTAGGVSQGRTSVLEQRDGLSGLGPSVRGAGEEGWRRLIVMLLPM